LPQRPYLQPCHYKDNKPFMPVLRQLHAEGKLNQAQSLIMAATGPAEELYDLQKDPWELSNLAADAKYVKRLQAFRKTLADWERDSGDRGRVSESAEMYDSYMSPYVVKVQRKNPEQSAVIQRNIELMKRWSSEGK
jgi:hypothetical protein